MTFPFSRLLLATEHTEFDTGSERVAFDLARRYRLPLHGVLPMVSNAEYESIAPGAVLRAEERVFALVTQLRDEARTAGIEFDLRVRRGAEPYREIIAEAQERSADLVVIRRRGRQSILANLLVGEMVGKVATAAPCSVLMVPRAARVWTRRVLAGIDGTHAGTEVARTAARMAAAAGLPLTLLSVAAHGTAEERGAAEHAIAAAVAVARGEGADVEGQAAAGRPADGIVECAAMAGADLLVVGRGGAGRHARLHFGSTAQRVVGLASCAVLVVRA